MAAGARAHGLDRWPVRAAASVGLAGAGLGALTFLGGQLGPLWRGQAWRDRVRPATPETSLGAAPRPGHGLIQELKVLDIGPARVRVAISRPRTAGAHPVLLFMHGAGTGHRVRYDEHARVLADLGIACVVPDKRLDTYSTASRDYVEMARDYLVTYRWALGQEWADSERSGVLGESEGGWIAPIAAALSPEVSFVVLVSPPVVQPRAQMLYAAAEYLHNTQVPRGLFHVLPRIVGSRFPGGFEYADFDGEEYYGRVTVPLFVAYGTADTSMPVEQGARILIDALRQAGGPGAVVRYYEQANHSILVGGQERLSRPFLSDLATFAADPHRAVAEAPQVAGDAPGQEIAVGPVPHVPLRGQMMVQAAIAGSGAVALAAGGAVAAATARGRRSRGGARLWPAAAMLTATAAGTGVYLSRVARLALNYTRDDRLVVNGYRTLRLDTAATSVAFAVAATGAMADAARGRISRPRRLASGLVAYAGAAAGVSAAYLGLLPTRRRVEQAAWPGPGPSDR